MKKYGLCLLLLVFTSLSLLFCAPPPKKKVPVPKRLMLKGSIKTPLSWKQAPEFRLFFEGQRVVSDEQGFYAFPLDQKVSKFYFLICKNVDQNFDNLNTIDNLSIKHVEKPYKYYSFKMTDTKTGQWIQKEKTLEKKNFVIPENCVIVAMNPKYVDQVTDWHVNLEDNFIKLPQIVLKGDYPEKKVKREAAKSLLRTLDSTVFHEHIELARKDDKPQVKISLPR